MSVKILVGDSGPGNVQSSSIVSRSELLGRFTDAELDAIFDSKGKPAKFAITILQLHDNISLESKRLDKLLQGLVNAALLTAERKAEILGQ